jgi:outer membrane biosynthesis protein TonB
MAEPGYPPNAISGGTVVAELLLSSGSVARVKILNGEAGAFGESAESALRAWRFAREQKMPVMVVVHFRDPNFYSTGPATRTVAPPPAGLVLAYPKTVVDPAYPANSMGEGCVVLRLDIAATGAVAGTDVIKEAGGLTQASIDAVRKWIFLPAKDSKGRPTESSVFAVLVFRMPVIPTRPPK